MEGVRAGEVGAADLVLERIYGELQGLARAVFSEERRGHTLQPTALVHEAWQKLVGDLGRIEDRRQFFALAARAMRRVLKDHARAHRRLKRGGAWGRVTLDGWLRSAREDGIDLIDLDDTLDRLKAVNDRHARVVELRLFGGLTVPETAETLGVATATVERDWFLARGWLRQELLGA